LKKYLFLFFILTFSLFANIQEAQILQYIIKNINQNSFQKIWSDDEKIKHSFQELGYDVVKNATNADLLIIKKKLPSSKIKGKIFVLKYNLLNTIPKSFGAFFWKKGRPNIVFITPRVKKEHLRLSKELQEYEEDKVW